MQLRTNVSISLKTAVGAIKLSAGTVFSPRNPMSATILNLLKAGKFSINDVARNAVSTVSGIEGKALSVGWTLEQLWHIGNGKRYDNKGLVYFFQVNYTIGEITTQYIEIKHDDIHKGTVTHKYYNKNVDQPWLTHLTGRITDDKNDK